MCTAATNIEKWSIKLSTKSFAIEIRQSLYFEQLSYWAFNTSFLSVCDFNKSLTKERRLTTRYGWLEWRKCTHLTQVNPRRVHVPSKHTWSNIISSWPISSQLKKGKNESISLSVTFFPTKWKWSFIFLSRNSPGLVNCISIRFTYSFHFLSHFYFTFALKTIT